MQTSIQRIRDASMRVAPARKVRRIRPVAIVAPAIMVLSACAALAQVFH